MGSFAGIFLKALGAPSGCGDFGSRCDHGGRVQMGAEGHAAQYVRQVEDYALCIRDFHAASQGSVLVPIVCAERAPKFVGGRPSVIEAVASAILTNAADLSDALRIAASLGSKQAVTL